MRPYARWRALERHEKRLTVNSAVVMAVAAAVLRLLGVERTLRMAARPIRGASRTVIGDVVAAVDRAGRYAPGGTCLSKSLALAWILRRRGIPVSVRIGTRTDQGRFEAHAWVESEGVAVNDAPPGYAALVNSLQFTVDRPEER